MAAPKLPRCTDELLASLEEAQCIVPDELTQHYTRKAGEQCRDARLLRLIGLAAQHFVASVAFDTLQATKRKRDEKGGGDGDKKPGGGGGGHRKPPRGGREKLVLRPQELAETLSTYGVNVKPAPYFLAKQ
jgi:hypothetical protein